MNTAPVARRFLRIMTIVSVSFAGKSFGQRVPEFEVASVKLSGPRGSGLQGIFSGGPGTKDPTLMHVERVTLLDVLLRAYGVASDQISGPGWLRETRYDFSMRVPPGVSKQEANVMLQNLLAERFHLTFHRVMKDFPVYVLTVAKAGAKLRETARLNTRPARPSDSQMPLDRDGFPQFPPGTRGTSEVYKNRLQHQTSVAISMPEFAKVLSGILANPWGGGPIAFRRVVDRTGLTGRYDFKLEYAIELPRRLLPSTIGLARGFHTDIRTQFRNATLSFTPDYPQSPGIVQKSLFRFERRKGTRTSQRLNIQSAASTRC